MKKLLVVLLLVGAGSFLVYRYALGSPEKRSCARLAQLCGMKADEEKKCVSDLAEMSQKLGADPYSKFNSCVADANSCPAGIGCYAGVGMRAIGDAMGQFMDGLGKALQK
jgi:hypothetical protein